MPYSIETVSRRQGTLWKRPNPRATGVPIRYRAAVNFKGLEDTQFIKTTGGNPGNAQEGICFGDSGGPLFRPGDQKTVLGVASTVGNDVCAGQTYYQRIDLPEVLSWIRSFL